MNKIFKIYDEDGDTSDVSFPSKREVCPRCDGYGTHDHEAFDGLTNASDWEEREAYHNGDFDVQCSVCHGDKVVDVIYYELLTDEQKTIVNISDEIENDIAQQKYDDAECHRAECGYAW